MTGTTLDFDQAGIDDDKLATTITNRWTQWSQARQPFMDEVKEIRNYVFATDTSTTSNKALPWKNSTTLPKLCQIRDNLHANYMAALFPSSDWLSWEGNDEDSEALEKRETIISYMRNKLSQVKFRSFVSQLVYDYIDYGNLFCTAKWVSDTTIDPIDETEVVRFIGAKPVRISPHDIVFDPTAATFEDTPKIVRSLKSIGEVKRMSQDASASEADRELFEYAIERALDRRRGYGIDSVEDKAKEDAFRIDGFGSLNEYYGSGMVELLQFVGTIYDVNDDVLYEDYVITVIDRSFVLKKEKNPSWLKNEIIHVGWRTRPDNLYAMSPLANLVGMQYRIDHLENLKADVFDMVAFPVLKIKGHVDDFEYVPNERIYCGDEGDVTFMHPDVTALNADTQISILEQKMEEMAGAPKQSMGIRTAGEKTAYEVQVLENNASRVFLNKTSYLEENGIEPLINIMLELSRRNMSQSDLVRTLDSNQDVVTFTKVTKEDLKASGKIKAVGAARFARKANLVQNLTQLSSSALGQDPAINVHFSGVRTAKLLEELLELEKYDLYEENVRVMEQATTQRLIQQAGEQLEVEANTPAGINPADQGI